jgi:hypothetical protein
MYSGWFAILICFLLLNSTACTFVSYWNVIHLSPDLPMSANVIFCWGQKVCLCLVHALVERVKKIKCKGNEKQGVQSLTAMLTTNYLAEKRPFLCSYFYLCSSRLRNTPSYSTSTVHVPCNMESPKNAFSMVILVCDLCSRLSLWLSQINVNILLLAPHTATHQWPCQINVTCSKEVVAEMCLVNKMDCGNSQISEPN